MARLTYNERLMEEAHRRAQEDPIYFPVRIHTAKDLAKMSLKFLKKRHLRLVEPLEEAA
jgi:hypothetical protein